MAIDAQDLVGVSKSHTGTDRLHGTICLLLLQHVLGLTEIGRSELVFESHI
jgi:hypothetical protein